MKFGVFSAWKCKRTPIETLNFNIKCKCVGLILALVLFLIKNRVSSMHATFYEIHVRYFRFWAHNEILNVNVNVNE